MMAATRSLIVALGAALLLAGCGKHSAPSVARQNATLAAEKRATPEVKLGVRAYSHHSYKIALDHFDRALKLAPDSTNALYDRALTEERLGSYTHAGEDLGAALRARPVWYSARVHLAASQFHAHRFADAAKNFDIALKTNPKGSKLWLDGGVSYYRLRQYGQARKRFARALDLAPRSGRAHYWLGMTYQHLANKSKARAELALAAHSRDVVVRTAARHALKH
ncbi:MAG: tetratricopeptide repeat protein [Candidatus Baltobacteraceae bacterium]